MATGWDGASMPHYPEPEWARLFRANRAKVASGDPGKAAEVVRDLSRMERERGLPAAGRRLLARAREIAGDGDDTP
ncbi:MAG TPA: hypothetical protein VH912_06205 [Streptosporangiaceae bacterium]|jgi:CarD family transcriptional regulator